MTRTEARVGVAKRKGAKPPPRQPSRAERPLRIAIRPLTPARWRDFVRLLSESAGCACCSCMWPRLPAREYRAGRARGGASNRRAMKRLVGRALPPGLLAYTGRRAVGWCAVGPRVEYVRIETSRNLKPIDDRPAWAVPCFYIARDFRTRGVATRLLEAAVRFAAARGGALIEGYPQEPWQDRVPGDWVWTGVPSLFRKAGFTVAARRARTRPIMRRAI